MKPSSFNYESMGTHWEVSIWDEISAKTLSDLQKSIIALSKEFDNTYSRFISSSFVTKLSKQTGKVEVPPDFMIMLRYYELLYELSDKKFTPLVGQTLDDLGYDADYSLKTKKQVQAVPDLNEVVEVVDDTHINLKQKCLFDFGALGKGYFVENIKSFLQKEGLQHFLVNGSGDIAYQSNGEIIQAGLEDPRDPKKVIGVVEMTSGSMCSSGGNRRTWGKYHHIIDPDTLTSPMEIIASWIMADSATIADALATAVFLAPPENFLSNFKFEYLLLNKEYKVKRSAGFKAELFS